MRMKMGSSVSSSFSMIGLLLLLTFSLTLVLKPAEGARQCYDCYMVEVSEVDTKPNPETTTPPPPPPTTPSSSEVEGRSSSSSSKARSFMERAGIKGGPKGRAGGGEPCSKNLTTRHSGYCPGAADALCFAMSEEYQDEGKATKIIVYTCLTATELPKINKEFKEKWGGIQLQMKVGCTNLIKGGTKESPTTEICLCQDDLCNGCLAKSGEGPECKGKIKHEVVTCYECGERVGGGDSRSSSSSDVQSFNSGMNALGGAKGRQERTTPICPGSKDSWPESVCVGKCAVVHTQSEIFRTCVSSPTIAEMYVNDCAVNGDAKGCLCDGDRCNDYSDCEGKCGGGGGNPEDESSSSRMIPPPLSILGAVGVVGMMAGSLGGNIYPFLLIPSRHSLLI